MIKGDEQVFFKNDYKKRIGSKIITTGNELVKQEIAVTVYIRYSMAILHFIIVVLK